MVWHTISSWTIIYDFAGMWFWVVTPEAQHIFVIQINCWNGENMRLAFKNWLCYYLYFLFHTIYKEQSNLMNMSWSCFLLHFCISSWFKFLFVSLSGWPQKFSAMKIQMRSESTTLTLPFFCIAFLAYYFSHALYYHSLASCWSVILYLQSLSLSSVPCLVVENKEREKFQSYNNHCN